MLKANKSLQLTVINMGRPARAMNGVRGPGRNWQSWPAAELSR